MEQQEYSQSDGVLFVRVGILVLSIMVVLGLCFKYLPDAISVSNIGVKNDLPIYSVDRNDNKISLTFDCSWGQEETEAILDILTENKVKCTFFVTKEWAEQFPEQVKQIVANGHDIGNFGASFQHMTLLSEEDFIYSLETTQDLVYNLTGIEMNLFRPPFGDYNNMVVGKARDLGYHTIQWNVDSQDWKDYGVSDIVKRCTKSENLGPGSIILLHNGAKYTVEALEEVISTLVAEGYELVPVSELMYQKKYVVDSMGRQVMK